MVRSVEIFLRNAASRLAQNDCADRTTPGEQDIHQNAGD